GSSRLGIVLGDKSACRGPCEVVAVETRSRRETYEQFPGKRRKVTDHCSEAVIRVRELTETNRKWENVLWAGDGGGPFRYRFPAQDGWDELVIASEQTQFSVSPKARTFALPLNGFTTSYEKLYQVKPAGELSKDWLLGLPLLLEYPAGVWAAITEADVNEYAGLYLAPTGGGMLSARLSPLPQEPKVSLPAPLPHRPP